MATTANRTQFPRRLKRHVIDSVIECLMQFRYCTVLVHTTLPPLVYLQTHAPLWCLWSTSEWRRASRLDQHCIRMCMYSMSTGMSMVWAAPPKYELRMCSNHACISTYVRMYVCTRVCTTHPSGLTTKVRRWYSLCTICTYKCWYVHMCIQMHTPLCCLWRTAEWRGASSLYQHCIRICMCVGTYVRTYVRVYGMV